MAADFLGSMFQGIGDTFTAGSNVNVAKIKERETKAANATNLEGIYYQNENAKLDFLNQAAKNQLYQNALIAAVVLIIVVVAIIYK